jgi:hypothetical protein
MSADQARDYRRFAAECLAVARKSSPQVHANLIAVAQNWLDLADCAERRALNHHAIQALIGEQLRELYKISSALPPHLLALLAQLNHGLEI